MTFLRHLALRGARSTSRSGVVRHGSKRFLATEVTTASEPQILPPLATLGVDGNLQPGSRGTAAQILRNKNTILHTTSQLGSDLEEHYRPNDLYVNPPTPADVSVELLLASQTHFGHSTSLWHPGNSRYIFGIREGIHIISPDVTASHLRRAARVVSGVAERAGIILFVGTRKGQERFVVRAAELAGACHLFDRWIPGTITNGEQILGKSSMKVVDENDKDIEGFDNQLSELPVLKPDLVVCFNPLEHNIMLHECGLANIPTVGIIDTDVNPTWVTYPIPANDDSLRSVAVIAGVLGRAGEEGQRLRMEAAKKGKATYLPPLGLQHTATEEEAAEVGEETDKMSSEALPNSQPQAQATPRMGQGSNMYEAGIDTKGNPLPSEQVRKDADPERSKEFASEETKATPGKEPNTVTDILMNPMSRDPGGSQGKPEPQRKLEQQDREMHEDSSQIN